MNHRLYKTEKLLSKVAKGGFFSCVVLSEGQNSPIRGNQDGGPIGAERAHLFSSVHGHYFADTFCERAVEK